MKVFIENGGFHGQQIIKALREVLEAVDCLTKGSPQPLHEFPGRS